MNDPHHLHELHELHTRPDAQDVHTLQSLVLPDIQVCSEEAMYLRLNDRAWAGLESPGLYFLQGGLASTDTFYNGVTLSAWRRLCDVRSASLVLEGAGHFVVSIGLHRAGQASLWLGERSLRLEAGRPHAFDVPSWERFDDGLLFMRLRALESGWIGAARYVTALEPPNPVRLGIVITHFNRPVQVAAAVDRLTRQVLDRADLRRRITLTVIDNSGNLPVQPRPGVEVIANRNLGGSGGFTRGLLELVDGASHTHALFMDDDASCETESIVRSSALLQYARDPHLAVSGSLLREVAPWQLLEKGVRFDHQVRAQCGGLDMRRVEHLLEAELPRAAPDYGAWWFFAFPLRDVRRYPFPFFVRGDDVLFGLANRFPIATLNGVGCFGEDFGVKHSPLTAYLDARYHLVLALLDRRGARRRVLWVARRLFLQALKTYHYSSARAVVLAMKHVMSGPQFFVDHIDLRAVREEIGAWLPSEKPLPLAQIQEPVPMRPARRAHESPLRTLLRLFTLQGFLLPDALLKDRTTVLEKDFLGRSSAVFRYRRVVYRHAQSGTGYRLEHDRRRFFGALRDFMPVLWSLLRNTEALHREYVEGVDRMTTPGFWRGIYGLPVAGRSQTVPAMEEEPRVVAKLTT